MAVFERTFDKTATADAINDFIKTAGRVSTDTVVVKLAAGVYNLDNPIRIERSNVKLLGAGDDGKGTELRIAFKAEKNVQALIVEGKEETFVSNLAASTSANKTKTLTLEKLGAIKVGSVIKIEQLNDQPFIDKYDGTKNGRLDAREMNADGQILRGQLAKVVAVSGNKVTIESATPYSFSKAAKVSLADGNYLENVTVGGFKITTDIKGKPDKYKFENVYNAKNGNPDAEKPARNAAVDITNVKGMSLFDVTTKNVVSNAFDFSNVYGSAIRDLTADGTFNKGGEGNGYAFLLKAAFNNRMANLTDVDMRHSVIMGSFSPEHYNKIHVKFTNRDINFHGSPDSKNTIVVDKSVMDFKEKIHKDGVHDKPAVSGGNPEAHPLWTIEANEVVFKYLQGGPRMDVVYGSDEGSKLWGNGDMDQLTGGKGADYLNGGTHDDILTGKGGRDTFAFKRDFGRDLVTDFNSKEDTLDLTGSGVTSKAGLSVKHVRGDTIVSLGGGTFMTLEDVSASEWKSAKVLFDSEKSPSAKKGYVLEGIGGDLGYSGSAGKDTFILKTGYLENRPDLLGFKGTDTLKLTSGSIFNAADLGRTVGIDVLDVVSTPRGANVTINKKFTDQADNDSVTIKIDKSGLFLRTQGITNPDAVKISGSGEVKTSKDGAVFSSAGSALKVSGGSGVDKVKGAGAADTIDGGGNNDVLDGGGGKDKLTGGGGNDSFVFSTKLGSGNVDTITDFSSSRNNTDRFMLDRDIFSSLKGEKLSSDSFLVIASGKAVKAAAGNDYILYDKSKGDLYYDADGSSGKHSAVLFASVKDNTTLDAGDFVLI